MHSNFFFKTLPQPFFIAQSQKSYGVRHSILAGSNPRMKPHLFYPPPSHLCLYYTTGGKLIRRRKIYAAAD